MWTYSNKIPLSLSIIRMRGIKNLPWSESCRTHQKSPYCKETASPHKPKLTLSKFQVTLEKYCQFKNKYSSRHAYRLDGLFLTSPIKFKLTVNLECKIKHHHHALRWEAAGLATLRDVRNTLTAWKNSFLRFMHSDLDFCQMIPSSCAEGAFLYP